MWYYGNLTLTFFSFLFSGGHFYNFHVLSSKSIQWTVSRIFFFMFFLFCFPYQMLVKFFFFFHCDTTSWTIVLNKAVAKNKKTKPTRY